MADICSEAIALYDRYTHQGLDRRTLMTELTRIAGSAAAASALLTAIAADPAAAATIDEKDPRLIIRRGPIGLERGKLDGYVVAPQLGQQAKKIPALLLVHENRGLNRHVEDVARRLALAGFFVVAPDFLTEFGGTPSDEDKARELMGKLDLSARVADAVEAVAMMRNLRPANGKVGAIGFCWGGAFVNRLAVAAGDQLDAVVPYYGPAPDPSEAAKVKAAMLLHYAGIDERVNVTAAPWIAALKKAGVPTEAHFYEGANHAFNNDTSAERYNKAAADLAWRRTIAFLERELA